MGRSWLPPIRAPTAPPWRSSRCRSAGLTRLASRSVVDVLYAARTAQQGYAVPVPIGHAHDPFTGRLELSPDQVVRHAVEQLVHLFAQLGSMRGVLLCLKRAGLQPPHQVRRRGLATQIVWRRPSYEVVTLSMICMLSSPVAAGPLGLL